MADEINVSAARFNNIKARLKEVLKNRKYYGDISSYSNSIYDFDINPSTGSIILSDQGKKVINIILAVNDINDLKKIENDNYILRDVNQIEEMISKMEKQTPASTNNICRGGCIGICVDHCSTACIGNCKLDCSDNNCSVGCKDACVHACSNCSGTCSGSGCKGDCKNNCTGGQRN